MAIEFFQIEWTNLFPFDIALHQPEAQQGGIYALHKSMGKTKRLHYIGKTNDFSQRFGSHKQNTAHMMTEAERKKCFVCFGLISSFEKNRMSTVITPKQLRDIENFFLVKLQPIGCGESTRKRYTGNYSIIVANAGKIPPKFDKFMSHSPELLKILGKSVTTTTETKKRKRSSSWFNDLP